MRILRKRTGDLLLETDNVNLIYADLSGADLTCADLRYADLTGANLTGADLYYCIGNRGEIKSIFISKIYPITYTSEVIQIGCENHTIKDWFDFDDKKILSMDGKKALKFWRLNKELIQLCIKTNPATSNTKKGGAE